MRNKGKKKAKFEMNIQCEFLDGVLTDIRTMATTGEAAMDLERLVWDPEYREAMRERWTRPGSSGPGKFESRKLRRR